MCVSEPPSIQERPEVVRVARGHPVRLEGRVSGSPQVSVRWSKEGKTLDSYRKYQLFPEGNLHRLSFEFCELEDKEANLPEATNPGGSCSCTVGLVLLGL